MCLTEDLPFKFRAVVAWAGGAAFVLSLVYFLYFYTVVLGRPALTRAGALYAFGLDVGLFSLFAVHHSVMARSGAKALLTRAIPPSLERVVYVWMASALLFLACWLWQPIGGVVYAHTGVAWVVHLGVQALGVWIIARATRMLDPLDLAGIRQSAARISHDGPYGLVRHPIYFGWLLLTFGVATMTVDRLVFAAISAAYLLIAVSFEERSLEHAHGPQYRTYKQKVRWRIVPYVW